MPQGTKACPFCGEEILAVAKKCRYCEEYFDAKDRPRDPSSAIDRMLLPTDRPPSAIAAGYLGLFALFPFIGLIPAMLAIIFGILALKKIAKDSSLAGRGRAWFGIISGILMTIFWGAGVVFFIVTLILEARGTPRHG